MRVLLWLAGAILSATLIPSIGPLVLIFYLVWGLWGYWTNSRRDWSLALFSGLGVAICVPLMRVVLHVPPNPPPGPLEATKSATKPSQVPGRRGLNDRNQAMPIVDRL